MPQACAGPIYPFPLSNTPRIVQGNPNSAVYVALVNISGSGYLTSVSAIGRFTLDRQCYAQITLDGVQLITEALIWNNDTLRDYGSCNPIAGCHRFASSLLIEGREDVADTNSRFLISYILASALTKLVKKESKKVETSDNTYIYEVEDWITENGKPVHIETLIETIPKKIDVVCQK